MNLLKSTRSLFVISLAGCSSVSISTDFEAGSLGRIEQVSETEFRCAVAGQADHEGRNRQASWYCFRVDGAKGREITVVLTDLKGEYNYKPAPACVREDTPPVVSGDTKTWRHLDKISVAGNEATIRFTPDSDAFFVAHIEPYTVTRLERFIAEIRSSANVKDYVFGKSVEGRDLHVLTITEVEPKSGAPKIVWLLCRQHAWETGTSYVAEGAIRYLLTDAAAPLRRQLEFRIIPMLDPDGCAAGGVRFNRNGYDLNRNWDTADPENPENRRLMPEICAAKKLIQAWKGTFLTLHNQETGEWLSGSAQYPDVAEKLYAKLSQKTSFDPSEKGPRTPAGKIEPGRYSVYEYLDREKGMPAFLLEQGITQGKKLGHLPTSGDRREFGQRLIQVLAEVALGK
ncbi:MAG TPA: M14-type cytosolic carboxypeptidase [Planctomycetota bacterium]|nr:M14-type cytosolic carboxypeptidase [Planctomycetota bacterium]